MSTSNAPCRLLIAIALDPPTRNFGVTLGTDPMREVRALQQFVLFRCPSSKSEHLIRDEYGPKKHIAMTSEERSRSGRKTEVWWEDLATAQPP